MKILVTQEGEELVKLRNLLDAETDPVGFDTETTGWSPGETPVGRAVVVCFSLAGPGWAAVVDGRLLHHFRDWLEDASRPKIVANSKFEQHVALNHGIRLRGVIIDTVLASYTLEPHNEGRHGVKEAVEDHLGIVMTKFIDVVPDGDVWRAWHMERERLAEYAMNDAKHERELGIVLKRKLNAKKFRHGSAWDFFVKYQMPYNDVLFEMERRGVRVDREYLEKAAVAVRKALKDCEYRLAEHIGRPLRMSIASFVGSHQQLANFLYKERKLDPPLKTRGWSCGECGRTITNTKDSLMQCPIHPRAEIVRTNSTSKAALEILAQKDPFAGEVNRYRHLVKVKEQIDNILSSIQVSGRVHTSYRQFGTKTQRLSSADPNLQNLLSPDKDSFLLRKAFLPSEGHVLLDRDYNQLEYRLLAHLTGEPRLIEGFRAGADYHSLTAQMMFRLPCKVSEVKEKFPKERKRAKNGNFCINYRGGAKKLAFTLGCSLEEAQKFVDLHKQTFPLVHAWWDLQARNAQETGYVEEVLSGWQRPVPHIHSDDPWLREAAIRVTANTPIQGAAATVMRSAMLRIHGENGFGSKEADRLRDLGVKMILQVHDELVFDVPRGAEKEAAMLTGKLMEHALDEDLLVPLPTDVKIGPSWGEVE